MVEFTTEDARRRVRGQLDKCLKISNQRKRFQEIRKGRGKEAWGNRADVRSLSVMCDRHKYKGKLSASLWLTLVLLRPRELTCGLMENRSRKRLKVIWRNSAWRSRVDAPRQLQHQPAKRQALCAPCPDRPRTRTSTDTGLEGWRQRAALRTRRQGSRLVFLH